MSMINNKNAVMFFVFLLLLVILVNPRYVHHSNNSIIGRFLFVFFIIVASMNNIFLGLFSVLVIIIASNNYYMEGMATNNGVTIGDDTSNANTGSYLPKISVITGQNSSENSNTDTSNNNMNISMLKQKSNNDTNGVDRESLKDSLKAKNSNQLPISKNMFKSTDNVSANESIKESFGGGCGICAAPLLS